MRTLDTMFLTVDVNDKRPLYQQIVDGIKALIANGQLSEGTPLPSVRQVAGDLGVNLNTVAVAYRQLQDEGFLTVRHGAGSVVSSRQGRAEKDEIRTQLRRAVTNLVLAGFSDRQIADFMQQELRSTRQQKGGHR